MVALEDTDLCAGRLRVPGRNVGGTCCALEYNLVRIGASWEAEGWGNFRLGGDGAGLRVGGCGVSCKAVNHWREKD